MHDVNYLNYDDEEICDDRNLENEKSDKIVKRNDIVKQTVWFMINLDRYYAKNK